MKNPNRESQKDLEIMLSKYQLLPVLRKEFGSFVDNHEIGTGIESEMVIEVLAQIYLHRQADPATMVGLLFPKFGSIAMICHKLEILVHLDFLDYDEVNMTFMVKYDISDDIKALIDKYQYPLPMVVKPKPVKENFHTGYETIKGMVVLNGSDYFDDKDLCLDHLNRANSVALEMNFDVIDSNEGKFVKPTRQIGEDFEEFNKRVRQAKTFYETSVQVMAQLDTITDEIYLTHKYDRRGRVYASGYHISSQGDDYRKAVLNLSNKELVW